MFACNKPNLKFLIFFIKDTYLGTVALCIHFFFLLGLFYFAIARVEVQESILLQVYLLSQDINLVA